MTKLIRDSCPKCGRDCILSNKFKVCKRCEGSLYANEEIEILIDELDLQMGYLQAYNYLKKNNLLKMKG